jgi:DNA-binding GntR family transcriptional regulator
MLTTTVSIEESWVPVGLIPDPDAIGISLYDYFRSQNISRSVPVHG